MVGVTPAPPLPTSLPLVAAVSPSPPPSPTSPPSPMRSPAASATASETAAQATGTPTPTTPLAPATPVPPSATAILEVATAPPLPTAVVNAATPPIAPSDPPTAGIEEQRLVVNPQAGYELAWEHLPVYTIRATLQPPEIAGRLSLRFPNSTGASLDSVVLRLFPNGAPLYAGYTEVSGVTVDGQVAAPSLQAAGTALEIPLPSPLTPGSSVTVEADFTTTLGGPGTGYGILNQAGGVTTLGSWFPLLALYDGGWQVPAVPAVGDAVSSEIAVFSLELTAPAPLEVAGTGESLGRREEGERSTWRFVSGPARELALAASPAWVPLTATVDGVEVRYFAAPGTGGAPVPAEHALQIAVAAVQTFGRAFGPYPYRQLDIVEADVPIGGYEYPGLVLFDSRQRASNDLARVRFLLAHEVAHQWFYALVGNNVTAEPWLDESLATFATLLTTEEAQGQAAAAALRATWEQEYAIDLARQPVGVNQPVYNFRDWRTYRGPVYYAGALMLDDLRRELGDELFFEALRRYVRLFAFRRATTNDLQTTFEQSTGRDLDAFFERWLVR
ncbi:MAG TPA: M1 family metallopeptidase [Ardenticatenaceae bacterium]|nr:M1 family metallopeptidase [Ardenticatenaceae bacterium]